MGLVGGVLSATAMSWHGILLSETTRLATVGSAGAVTGGVLSFGQIGAFLGPAAFAFLLPDWRPWARLVVVRGSRPVGRDQFIAPALGGRT